MSDCDVFVGQPIVLDYEVYQLWIKGNSPKGALMEIQQRDFSLNTPTNQINATLHNYICHQYRNFNLMEHFFKGPSGDGGTDIFGEQFLFPLPAYVRQSLLDMYYSLDEPFLLEIHGKKLSTKMRRDLDEISSEIKIPLASCQRQFDNLKRILRSIEDLDDGIPQFIEENFQLSKELSMKYMFVLFMTSNKIETYLNKKKYSHLTLQSYEQSVLGIIQYWSISGSSLDLDPKFVHDISEVKMILFSEDVLDNVRTLVHNYLLGKEQHQILNKIKNQVKTLLRSIVNIGYGLRQDKEFKEIFSTIFEKIIEPCKKEKLALDEAQEFLSATQFALGRINNIQENYLPTVERFIQGLKICLENLYK